MLSAAMLKKVKSEITGALRGKGGRVFYLSPLRWQSNNGISSKLYLCRSVVQSGTSFTLTEEKPM